MKQLVIILIALSTAFNSCDQNLTVKDIEKDLLKESSKLFSYYENYNSDSLEAQSSIFHDKMINYISKYPSTLGYPFQSLIDSNVCNIATSKDGLFRIYSWDTWMGGTMHFFKNIYQYKSNGKVYSKPFDLDEDDASSFYSEIFTVIAGNKTYYLGISNAIFSSKDIATSIKAFTIENNSVSDTIKLFRTKKEFLNEINVEFDFFSVVDRPERPVKLIKYDADKKIVYIPVVEDKGKVTDRFILYQWKGNYFEHILTQKGPGAESAIQVIEGIFDEYTESSESTDSKENENAMSKAFKSLQTAPVDKYIGLLLDVWMYYDPTDFQTRKLIEPVFYNNKIKTIAAIDLRIKNKKEWENNETAPFSELIDLKERLMKPETQTKK